MRRYGEYRILGETLDDAAGEAFDKVAKMMKLGFPGGPIISRLAEFGDAKRFLFPRPMMHAPNFDFSFSGLKTSVLYMLRDLKKLDVKTKRDIAASFQSAVVDVLVAKTVRAAKRYQVKMVMIGGGVAANKKLRHDLGTVLHKQFSNTKYLLPNTKLTGDNALMIALAGYFNQKKKKAWRSLQARPNLRLDQR
jgi:N6-L-threonylcarbamoyladenine synthase